MTLQLNSQAIGDAIDEGIVGRYDADVVNGPVVKSLRNPTLSVIRGQCCQQFILMGDFHALNFQQSTEPRSVMMLSIAAFVFRRYDHGDHFPLYSAQWTFSIHQLFIQVIMQTHGLAVNAVDPKDVVLIRHPVIRQNHFLSLVLDECHFRPFNLNPLFEIYFYKVGVFSPSIRGK